jgi:hypothetical protein
LIAYSFAKRPFRAANAPLATAMRIHEVPFEGCVCVLEEDIAELLYTRRSYHGCTVGQKIEIKSRIPIPPPGWRRAKASAKPDKIVDRHYMGEYV